MPVCCQISSFKYSAAKRDVGAYTNQLCTIDPVDGDASLDVDSSNSKRYNVATIPWYNNVTIANGSSAVVDGAKRDREIWPGDMAVAMPSIFVSTNDLMSVQNSINALLMLQDSSGLLPYAGYPFNTLGLSPLPITYIVLSASPIIITFLETWTILEMYGITSPEALPGHLATSTAPA